MTEYKGKTVKAKLGKTRIIGTVIEDHLEQQPEARVLCIRPEGASGDGSTRAYVVINTAGGWKVKVIEPTIELPTKPYALIVPPADVRRNSGYTVMLDYGWFDGEERLAWYQGEALLEEFEVREFLKNGWTVEYAGRDES